MAPYSPTSSRFQFLSPRRPSAPLFLLVFVLVLGVFTFTVPTDRHREWAAAQLSRWGEQEAFAQEATPKGGMEDIEWEEEVPVTIEPVEVVEETLEVGSLREELEELDREVEEPQVEEVLALDEVVEDALPEEEEDDQNDLISLEAEEETALPPSPSPTTPLPKCKRTMLFHFAGLHGFGSEFSVFLRHAALARHYKYTLLVDTSAWNYGSWTSYFLPLPLTCTPPTLTRSRTLMRSTPAELEARTNPVWTGANHVVSHRAVNALDALFLNVFTKPEDLEELKRRDAEVKIELPLGPAETIPVELREAYRVLAEVLAEVWRPNEEMGEIIRALEGSLKLGEEREEAKEVAELTVAVHVRLGDKYLEIDKIGPDAAQAPHHTSSKGLHDSQLSVYLHAASSSVSSMLPPGEDDGAWSGKPQMVLMSDDPEAWRMFVESEGGQAFRVRGTEARERRREMRIAKRAAAEMEEVNPFKKTGGFSETSFNKLPVAQRVALTRTFVRDVTVLSSRADALVISGSSNVGRLMALLAGEEKTLTLGRVRSVDTRWFPTARYT